MHEIPSGKPLTYEGEGGLPVLQERPEGTAPCEKCPKSVDDGPDLEGTYQISTANEALLDLVHRSASPGFVLPDHLLDDRLFQERFATATRLIESLNREGETADLARDIAYHLSAIIRRY